MALMAWTAEPWRGVNLTALTPSPFLLVSQVRIACVLMVILSLIIPGICLGTAIYIFAILPPTEFSSAGTPTNTNLLFTLDNKSVGNFSSGTTANFTSTNVLSQHGLPNQLHQLVVTVGNDSIFIFDHLIYTNSSAIDSASSTPQPTHR